MRKGFSLLELLVAITIFGVVSTVTTNAYITSFKAEQRSQLQNSVMLDAKYIMDLITTQIESGKVDFEEYFNQCVIHGTCPKVEIEDEGDLPDEADQLTKVYGINYGLYNWQFYYSGTTTPDGSTADGYGDLCEKEADQFFRIPNVDCATGPLPFAEDAPTGVNPQKLVEDPDDQASIDSVKNLNSATCATNYQNFDGTQTSSMSDPCPPSLTLSDFTFNELYLIDSDETTKTIIGREKITDSDFAVSLIRLVEKKDPTSVGTGNYPVKVFECETGFECTNDTALGNFADGINEVILPTPNRYDFYNYSDGKNIFKDFVPISPLKINIKKLSFLIAPIEDPTLAYREGIKIYPQVTIILEVEPSNTFRLPFFSRNFNLKLQKTVSTYSAQAADLN